MKQVTANAASGSPHHQPDRAFPPIPMSDPQ
jgi:hypothetical protein